MYRIDPELFRTIDDVQRRIQAVSSPALDSINSMFEQVQIDIPTVPVHDGISDMLEQAQIDIPTIPALDGISAMLEQAQTAIPSAPTLNGIPVMLEHMQDAVASLPPLDGIETILEQAQNAFSSVSFSDSLSATIEQAQNALSVFDAASEGASVLQMCESLASFVEPFDEIMRALIPSESFTLPCPIADFDFVADSIESALPFIPEEGGERESAHKAICNLQSAPPSWWTFDRVVALLNLLFMLISVLLQFAQTMQSSQKENATAPQYKIVIEQQVDEPQELLNAINVLCHSIEELTETIEDLHDTPVPNDTTQD